ncbi:N-acetyltransferase GCN5 [Candidatus Magnetomorum sp. HK-1]|nr:N-acetyltransferase GCN5 [Candidatus Magnetomorum sp. HK-1]
MQRIRHYSQLNKIMKNQNHMRFHVVAHSNLNVSAIYMWPARRHLLIDGWILRFFHPYSYRCNCIYPLGRGKMDIHEKIKKCEYLYQQSGYKFIFKILPQFHYLDRILKLSGYKKINQTRWMSVSTKKFNNISANKFNNCLLQNSNEWLLNRQIISGYTDIEADVYKIFHCGITLKKYPFVLQINHTPVACALGIQYGENLGIFDVRTKADFQRQGCAKTLIQAIIHHAQKNGAKNVQLHVEIDNIAAINLYKDLGFNSICDYWFRRIKQS